MAVGSMLRRTYHVGMSEHHKGAMNMDFEGYCVKCRTKREIKGGEVKETPNGRKMVQGVCPECKTKVTRFLSAKESK
jgi:hypothetical protein